MPCHITCVMLLCYITYDMSCYITCIVSCHITCVMLLCNMSRHVMSIICVITFVMSYNMCYVMLYNICHVI